MVVTITDEMCEAMNHQQEAFRENVNVLQQSHTKILTQFEVMEQGS